MMNFMILFAITVLIAAYSGIIFFTGTIKENARLKKSHYGMLCIIFIILAIIELIVYNVM
ncbi:Mid2-like cell wall stress sensor domain protein [Staphylococcus debuckii]|uniref:Mid2-like cell wall stress sensor domain protein n=1 Tax=Staphylococcus debuckii TaxID=2044912 RepID=A0ABU9EZ44_9STAP|nr:Mid2-like cell wall stress sensor domain protein [Staphylococcus debuckii]AYU55226.1 Mid2-like cell wall stress sensor domain protein [Staphylococcus debuckii]